MGWFSKVGSFIKNNAHTILDVAGMIPGVGAVADLANAALYAAEGDWANAAMSAVSAVPGIGDTIAMANKGMKAAKGVKTALKAGKSLKSMLKAGGKSLVKAIKGKAKAGAKAVKNWKETLGSIFKKKKTGDKHVCTNGKCFTGDTLVYTDKGYVPIKEIREGDRVYSRNEQTGETGYKKVEQISKTETHTIHYIEVNRNTIIQTTAYHPFYVNKKGWVSAISLQKGDRLFTLKGEQCITAIGKERYEEPVIMYNFHVEDWVSYFVSKLNLYVHNGNGHGKPKKKAKKKRLEYMGKTPGKSSKTGREVIERMTKEGKIKTVRGKKMFKDSKNKWNPLSEADMAHKTDAVTWWNKKGRKHGAKSKEVREFMLDSDNYYLEHYSINRSQGANLNENYLPPKVK